jgi:hypothetical protein
MTASSAQLVSTGVQHMAVHRLKYMPYISSYFAELCASMSCQIAMIPLLKRSRPILVSKHAGILSFITCHTCYTTMSGAGGAVYFWDLATGARLSDAEHVDKMAIYAGMWPW